MFDLKIFHRPFNWPIKLSCKTWPLLNVANGGFRVCKNPFNVNASIFYRCIISTPAQEPSERINDIDLGLTRVIERGGREETWEVTTSRLGHSYVGADAPVLHVSTICIYNECVYVRFYPESKKFSHLLHRTEPRKERKGKTITFEKNRVEDWYLNVANFGILHFSFSLFCFRYM